MAKAEKVVLVQIEGVPKSLADALNVAAKRDMLKRAPWLRIKLAELVGWKPKEER